MDSRVQVKTVESKLSTKSNKSDLWRRIGKNYQLYILLLIPLAWLFIFKYGPMYGIQIAFKNYQVSKGIMGSPWIGFNNFVKFFNTYRFVRLLTNTLGVSLYQLVAGFPVPILLALALNASTRNKFKKTVQFVTYMPYFISTVVMVGIVMQFLNPRIGLINKFIVALGGQANNFMAVPEYFKSIYVWSGIWQTAGWGTIIYLATLAGIDQELHEAAMIDGASRFKRIIHIDLPGIIPTAVILLIMNAGHIMNIGFEKVFLMQNPLNLRSSEVISTYVYTVSLASPAADFAYATAIDVFNGIINLLLIIAVNQIAKKFGETSLW